MALEGVGSTPPPVQTEIPQTSTSGSQNAGAVEASFNNAAAAAPQAAYDKQVDMLKSAAGEVGVNASKFDQGGFTATDASKIASNIQGDPTKAAEFAKNAAVSGTDPSLKKFDLTKPESLAASLNDVAAKSSASGLTMDSTGSTAGKSSTPPPTPAPSKDGSSTKSGGNGGAKETGGPSSAGNASEAGDVSEDDLAKMLEKLGLSPEEAKKLASKMKSQMKDGKLSVEDFKKDLKEAGVSDSKIASAVKELDPKGTGQIDGAALKSFMGGDTASSGGGAGGDSLSKFAMSVAPAADNSNAFVPGMAVGDK